MREIGGYLELETLINNEHYSDAIALNLARNALVYLVKAKNINKVYLPYFLCDSVSNVCDRENIKYEFYHIDESFSPVFDKQLNPNEYLYIVNYYGQVDKETIEIFKKKFKNIIVDNVQSFYETPVQGVDTIYSCRKFFGVPDGAYLISDASSDELLPMDNSVGRTKHIYGRYDGENASKYYCDFQENEKNFAELPLMRMSKSTRNIMGAIDYQLVMEKRTRNWKLLHESLKDKNKLVLKCSNGPYVYPFYCDNATEIRTKLIESGIYISLLWPNVKDTNADEFEKDLAENILPLPIDQRYNSEEMKRLLDELLKFL